MYCFFAACKLRYLEIITFLSMEGKFEMRLLKFEKFSWRNVYILLIILLCIPSTLITLYTFPIQDDFYNTTVVLNEMAQGKNAFVAACSKAISGYTTYSGYYFSLFLTYFTDAIVRCDIWGIRIIQFVMAICFYFSICLFAYSVTRHVMRYSVERALQTTTFLIVCMTCLHYFADNEDLYWFCASVIYLIPMTCIFLGVTVMVYAIKDDRKLLLIPVAILGFLSGGAVLNIAAFGCILFVMMAYWGIVVKKKISISLMGSFPMVLGGIINVVAPGNFVREKTPITGEVVVETLIGTFGYTVERFEMFITRHPLFPALLIILFILILQTEYSDVQYKFYVPLLFSGVMFVSVMITIFPVALGYNMEVYAVMERSNFISDLAIFVFSFLSVFYWRGWIAVKFPRCIIKQRGVVASYVVIIGILVVAFYKTNIREIAAIRQWRELSNGRIEEYADWNVSVIKTMENGEGDIVEIATHVPEDKTCLVGPKYYFGKYDYEKEFANRSMAMFYGKKAIYIYDLSEE